MRKKKVEVGNCQALKLVLKTREECECVLPSRSTMFSVGWLHRSVCECECILLISCLDVLLVSRRAGCSGTHGQPLFCQWFRIPQIHTHTHTLTLSKAPHPQAVQLSDIHSTSPTHPDWWLTYTEMQTHRINSGCPGVIDNWQLIGVVCCRFCKVTCSSTTWEALICPLTALFSALQAHLNYLSHERCPACP